MERKAIDTFDCYPEVMGAMQSRGLLLGAYDAAGKPNFMTIGWGMLGYSWRMPIWTVLVRPSRYTFGCVEHAGAFTVNVSPMELAKACSICGTQSGRDHDKVELAGLTASRSMHVDAPIEQHCPIIYHCKVVAATDLDPARVAPTITEILYATGDFHRVYFGDVIAVDASDDAREVLRP